MKQLITILYCIILSSAGAQTALTDQDVAIYFAKELVYVHSNANVLVPGETLYYKLYCVNGEKNTNIMSQIGYVELIDSSNNPIFSHKLFLEDGKAFGDFFISATIPTGSYKLLGYTSAILNNPGKIFETDLAIINPFKTEGVHTSSDSSSNPPSAYQLDNSLDFNLLPHNRTFSHREKISLNFAQLYKQYPNGDFSISVRRKNNITAIRPISAAQFFKNIDINSIAKPIIITPELRGEIIKGQVIGEPNKRHTVALSIPGKSFAFKVVNTDSAGKFTFNIDKPQTDSEVMVQIVGDDRQQYQINQLQRPTPDYTKFINHGLSIDPIHEDEIRKQSIAAQIENAYYMRKADTLASVPEADLFYEPVATKFTLNDYTRFPTFAETVIEVIQSVYFEQKNLKYSLYVRDNNIGREIAEPALVLVDGLMLQDVDELFAYPAAGIESISVYSGIYLYGPTAFNGVVSVVTKLRDFVTTDKNIVRFDISRPIPKKKYFRQVHDVPENQTIPDYRYQLLWLPKFNNSEAAFFTSDVSGTYELVIEGFSGDSEPVSIREIFEVK